MQKLGHVDLAGLVRVHGVGQVLEFRVRRVLAQVSEDPAEFLGPDEAIPIGVKTGKSLHKFSDVLLPGHYDKY